MRTGSSSPCRAASRPAIAPAAHPPGTTVEVRDLFHNVPARRKFLRSETTEAGHVARLLERLALSRFDVGFSYTVNGREQWRHAAANDEPQRHARLARILGAEFVAGCVPVHVAAGPLRLTGWTCAADVLACTARPAVLVRQRSLGARPPADERRAGSPIAT